MAGEITVRYRFNMVSGKHEIVVEYESDDDALPREHEERHKQIARKFAGEMGVDDADIVMDRIKPGKKKPGGTGEAGRRGEAQAGF